MELNTGILFVDLPLNLFFFHRSRSTFQGADSVQKGGLLFALDHLRSQFNFS